MKQINKVSIIICTHRRYELLKIAIKSLINQTYQNIELVLVDDNAEIGWNTRISSLVNNCSMNEVIYIKNEENLGSARSRNLGIEASTGDYVTFLDDDDEYEPKKIENQITAMISDQSEFSLTDIYLRKDGKIVQKRIRNIKNSNNLFLYHLKHHLTGTSAMMFKKDYLLKIGKFDEIDIGDEFYLMAKAILNKGTFTYVKGSNVLALLHTESGLSKSYKKIDGEIKLFNYKKKYFKEISFLDRRYITMRHYIVLAINYFRWKEYLHFIKFSLLSVINHPIGFIQILIRKF